MDLSPTPTHISTVAISTHQEIQYLIRRNVCHIKQSTLLGSVYHANYYQFGISISHRKLIKLFDYVTIVTSYLPILLWFHYSYIIRHRGLFTHNRDEIPSIGELAGRSRWHVRKYKYSLEVSW